MEEFDTKSAKSKLTNIAPPDKLEEARKKAKQFFDNMSEDEFMNHLLDAGFSIRRGEGQLIIEEDEIEKLKKQNAILQEVLTWYGNLDNYIGEDPDVMIDSGKHARRILSVIDLYPGKSIHNSEELDNYLKSLGIEINHE